MTGHTAGFRAGQQSAVFETYAANILYTQAREMAAGERRVLDELQHALNHTRRWQDWPEGDDHLIRGIN